jgi:hypothetical protein
MDSVVEMIPRNVHMYREPRYLIGATRNGQESLQRDPERPLGVQDLVFLRTDEHVHIWVMSSGADPLDLILVLRRHNDEREELTPERAAHCKLPFSLFDDAAQDAREFLEDSQEDEGESQQDEAGFGGDEAE